MAGRENDAPLLDGADAGRGAADGGGWRAGAPRRTPACRPLRASPGRSRRPRARASDNCAPAASGRPPADGPAPGPRRRRRPAWWCRPQRLSCEGIPLSASFALALNAAHASGGLAALSARRAVCRGHADRQPGRHQPARAARAAAGRRGRLRGHPAHPGAAARLRHRQGAGAVAGGAPAQRGPGRAGGDRAAAARRAGRLRQRRRHAGGERPGRAPGGGGARGGPARRAAARAPAA